MNRFDIFKTLVSISSPSLRENEIKEYIKNFLLPLRYQFREDSIGNIIFFKDIKAVKNCLVSHMDTVKGAEVVNLLEDDEKFYTNATALGADDKCAIAIMLELAEKENCNSGAFLFFVAEEIGLYGSANMDKALLEGFEEVSFFILDAQGDVGEIINEAVGKTRVTLICHGVAAHAGFEPENGVNAIKVLAMIASIIPQGRPNSISTCNIGSFIAEGSTNVVPALATLTFEVRSLDDKVRDSIVDSIISEGKMIANKYFSSLDSKVEVLYDHYKIAEDDKIVIKAKKAVQDARITSTTGGSDANSLNKKGYKAIVLSCGYHNPHSKNEYITKLELDKLYDVSRNLIVED